ncbi:MAG: DUF1559 domain-containing protein [Planctomycetaceae bacterium]
MYDFPPNRVFADTPWPTLLMHGVLVAICIAGFCRVLRQRAVPRKQPHLLWSLLAIAAVLMLIREFFAVERLRPAVIGYSWFGILCGVIGAVRANAATSKGVKSDSLPGSVGCVVILGLMLLVFLPVVQGVRQRPSSQQHQCRANMNHLTLGMLNYRAVSGTLPSASGLRMEDGMTSPPLSWRVAILPQIDETQLFNEYSTSQAWDSAANARLQFQRPDHYVCPAADFYADGDPNEPLLTSYIVPTGDGTIFGDPSGPALSLDEITDGTSNTVMVVEACGTDIVWTEPRDLDVTKTPLGVNLPGSHPGRSDGLLSSYHATGAHVGMADGSVPFISEHIDPQVLKKLTTANAADGPVEDW